MGDVDAMESTLRYPLTEILGSRASLLVMRALLRHGGEMSVATLMGHTGLSKRGVHHPLATLQAMRVVKSLGTGRTLLYKARADHPLFAALSKLFKAEETRFRAILDGIGDLADADDAILAVWLYGSVARSDDKADSDLDLTLAVRKGRAAKSEAAFREGITAFEAKFAFDASVIALDIADIRRLSEEADPWWTSLVRDALAIRGDRPDYFLRRKSRTRKPV